MFEVRRFAMRSTIAVGAVLMNALPPALADGAATTRPADAATTTSAPGEEKPKPLSAETFSGLKFRSIGPALMSGRIGDFAVNPANRAHYFVAVASGGVWKTTNAGTTWTPVFDGEGSYSIGCLAMDPKNPFVVWVGTGENNSQRSVGFGDGVYRTRDGGKSWENMGLADSEHIGMIRIDPRDSDVVYVAAQGPLWRPGNDRGLYKTTNGGRTWNRILHISDDTGINEVHLDPRDPDVLYATAYQRRRHVWTLINGGPESALYKSNDAGRTWRKLSRGLPDVDMGRIGLAISPANPDIVYAIVEAADDKSGFYRSLDRGETWDKRSDYCATSPMYYNEIVADPKNADLVYSLDTFMHETHDGGKSFRRSPFGNRHVDNHALWIDPANTDYLLVGCDGGIYDSFDRGQNWAYKANLPITQFYRVTVDNSEPFYYVYGGTQDNNTLGGPSRTTERIGVGNEHWFCTVGGDGFETQVDPKDPNIVYSQWQHGGLVRHDRKSGEIVDIKPREATGDDPLKWNWDSPLLISPHKHTRLYFAANRIFRSEDRGESWKAVSEDLTRRIDRNTLKVMGRIQPADAVAKGASTSFFGNLVSFTESPLVEDLIYAGSDDGLVHVSGNGGGKWRKIETFPGVPDMTYVSCLRASLHEKDRIYASFDNHKQGDFKPYLLRSDDRGQTWTSIAGDLPARDRVYSIAEDHVEGDLLFAGTEFGVYFTRDGGKKWIRLKGGIPTIPVRDIDIQRRENDLVLATFGRGFYILDDYSPLRVADEATLERDTAFFPIKDALLYVQSNRLGGRDGTGTQGAGYYAAANPPFGAVFTYYLKEKIQTRRERRKEAEKKASKENKPTTYPSMDDLRSEDEEKEPSVVLIVANKAGDVIRRLKANRDKGIHRAAWDLRYPALTPTRLNAPDEGAPWDREDDGPLALPGDYTVTLAKEVDGEWTTLSGPVEFRVKPLDRATFPAKDRGEALAFYNKISRLQRAAQGAARSLEEAQTRVDHIRKAIVETPDADPALLARVQAMQSRLNALRTNLRGDRSRARRNEPTPPSILDRIENVVGSQWYSSSDPTKTHRDAYTYAGNEFSKVLDELRQLVEKDLPGLEKQLEAAGAPWTPGRVPTWTKE